MINTKRISFLTLFIHIPSLHASSNCEARQDFRDAGPVALHTLWPWPGPVFSHFLIFSFSFSSFPFFCDADPVALQTVRGRGRLPPTRRLPPH